MKIITSGSKYIDIDAYASCIAYRELFKLKGIEAISVSTSKLNESITEQILECKQSLDSYQESEEQEFIILDVSEEIYFDTIVKKDKIVELIDHHPGFETVWKEKLGEKAQIESIGAVATIMVEKYQEEHLLNKMEKEVAYMLMAAILDNTLNFKAKITTNRDVMAYKKLQKIVSDNGKYCETYFLECQKIIEHDLINSIHNDTKVGIYHQLLPNVIAQLTVWDKTNIMKQLEIIYQVLDRYDNNWIMNLICIKDAKSYIISKHEKVKMQMQKLMHHTFNGNIMELPEVWLRKELIKEAIINEK